MLEPEPIPANPSSVATVRTSASIQEKTHRSRSGSFYGRALRKFLKDPVALISLTVLSLIVAITLLAPFIAENILHTTPETIMRTPEGRIAILRPPGPEYILGTDDLGRDALTRLLYAGQVSLTIGLLVAVIAVVVGAAAGLAAGFFGGWVDDSINAIIQFLFNVPSLFILILLSVLFRPNVLMLAVIFGIFSWPGAARQVRGVVLSARSLDYVEAARVLGASNIRIMYRHILPNVANILLVVAGFDVAGAIIGESALSYLGFGVQVPQASWGNMLSGSQDLFQRAPWLVYPPGIMVFVTVLCVVLITDSLRDAFDPRT
jgi:peptide/nickel transport system permease protein